MLRPYRELAGVPHLVPLLLWSLVGRFHQAGTLLALSFLVAGWLLDRPGGGRRRGGHLGYRARSGVGGLGARGRARRARTGGQ